MELQIARNGEIIGSLQSEDIPAAVAGGTVLLDDYAWREGMPDWIPVSQIISPQSSNSAFQEKPAIVKKQARPRAAKKQPSEKHDWRKDAATEKQISYLKSFGVEVSTSITKGEASDLIGKCVNDPKALKRQEANREAKWESAAKDAETEQQTRIEQAAYSLHRDVDDRKKELEDLQQDQLDRKGLRRSKQSALAKLEKELKTADAEEKEDLEDQITDLQAELSEFDSEPEMDTDDLKYAREDLKACQRLRAHFWKATFKEDWYDIDSDDSGDLIDYSETIDRYFTEYGQYFKIPTSKQIAEILDGLDNSSSDWDRSQPEAFYALLNRNSPDQMRAPRTLERASQPARARPKAKGKGCLLLLPASICVIALFGAIPYLLRQKMAQPLNSPIDGKTTCCDLTLIAHHSVYEIHWLRKGH